MRLPAFGRRILGFGPRVLNPASWNRLARVAEALVPARLWHREAGEHLHKTADVLRHDAPAGMYRSLLDHRVAEFAWRLPRRFKVRDGETKWLLRQILYRRVPRALVERPKMGFSSPSTACVNRAR